MLYKWLEEGGKPYHGGSGQWPLPDGDSPGEWLHVEGKIIPCEHGLHVCRAGDLAYWIAPCLFEVEIAGEAVDHDNKVVARSARLVRRLPWDERARLFAADCAERALLAANASDERCYAAVKAARQYASGEITDAELAAANSDAWSAASDAWSATWSVASDAWSAARSVSSAADSAAWSAASDAWSAARSAHSAADSAAWSASNAWLAERAWQAERILYYVGAFDPDFGEGDTSTEEDATHSEGGDKQWN